jgi:hypothetical protein
MRLATPGPHRPGRGALGAAGGSQPPYRLDTDTIRDLRPDLVLSQDLCAVCAVPSGHVNQALDILGCQAEIISLPLSYRRSKKGKRRRAADLECLR